MHYNWRPIGDTLSRSGDIRKAYRFHAEWSSGWIGHTAQSALALARAEIRARELDLEFRWEPDYDVDASFVETWEAKDQERWNADDHSAESCSVHDPDGNCLGSLSGIYDASPEYRRTVEAELALEAIGEYDRSSNLDGLDPDDLEAFAADPDKPEALREYAAIKAEAIRYRLGGEITLAILLEKLLDREYKLLPVHLRW